jgi:hypothetical protein
MGYSTRFCGCLKLSKQLDAQTIHDINHLEHNNNKNTPRYWCPWVITNDGQYLHIPPCDKSGEEDKWLQYIVDNYLKDKKIYCKGKVVCVGDDFGNGGFRTNDIWEMKVSNYKVKCKNIQIPFVIKNG